MTAFFLLAMAFLIVAAVGVDTKNDRAFFTGLIGCLLFMVLVAVFIVIAVFA